MICRGSNDANPSLRGYKWRLFSTDMGRSWSEGEPLEYIRHATIERRQRAGRRARSCDFPRHGGFYIVDWAFAYLHKHVDIEVLSRTLREANEVVRAAKSVR